MRKKIVLGLIGLAFAVFFLFGPTISPTNIEKERNRVLTPPPYSASNKAVQLHQTLFIADLHADSLLWNRDLTKKSDFGQVDIPRLIEGHVGLQVFAAVTKVPRNPNMVINNADALDSITPLSIVEGWPPRTWRSLKARALYQAEKLRRFEKKSPGQFVILRSVADLDRYLALRQINPTLTAGLLAIEGAHALEGNPENVDDLFNAGYRMISPSHLFDSEMGGSAQGKGKGPLTDLGRDMFRRMEEKGMIIDLSHASAETLDQTLKIVHRPVIVSHTGVHGVCPNSRNLTDDQIRGVAKTGGLIGIGYWDVATCGTDVGAIARSILYTAKLVGPEHVALGSDFDGSVTTPFDTTGLVMLTDALLKQGMPEKDIRRVMGENVLLLLRTLLPRT